MDSFVFYESFLEAIELLPEEEQFKAYKLIAKYGCKGELPEGEQTIANAIFAIAKPNIDAARKNRENGSNGGRPRKDKKEKSVVSEEETTGNGNEKPMVIENKKGGYENTETNVNVNVNEKVNENVNENVKEKEVEEKKQKAQQRFIPPTREEVATYAKENKLPVDAERFIDYYASNGWMVGKNKMKDWRATVRNWSRKESNKAGPTIKPKEQGHNEYYGKSIDDLPDVGWGDLLGV